MINIKEREKTWKKRGVIYSVKMYLEQLIKQNYKCDICHTWINTSSPLDHDHLSGKIRGILCKRCNLLLGQVQDDKNILKSAIEYLEKYS